MCEAASLAESRRAMVLRTDKAAVLDSVCALKTQHLQESEKNLHGVIMLTSAPGWHCMCMLHMTPSNYLGFQQPQTHPACKGARALTQGLVLGMRLTNSSAAPRLQGAHPQGPAAKQWQGWDGVLYIHAQHVSIRLPTGPQCEFGKISPVQTGGGQGGQIIKSICT